MFTVVITEKGGEQRQLNFDKAEVSIGRVQGNDIVLAKGNISKRHARIALKDGHLVVLDLKSTNGIHLDGVRLESIDVDRVVVVRLGEVELELSPSGSVFRAGGKRKSAPAAAPTAAAKANCLFRRDGKEHGPHTWEELQEMAAGGTIKATDVVWIPGAAGWTRRFAGPVRYLNDVDGDWVAPGDLTHIDGEILLQIGPLGVAGTSHLARRQATREGSSAGSWFPSADLMPVPTSEGTEGRMGLRLLAHPSRGVDIVWRYEVDVRRFTVIASAGASMVIGDAKLLVDGEEIYQVKGARVGLFRDIGYPDYPLPSEYSRGGRMEQ